MPPYRQPCRRLRIKESNIAPVLTPQRSQTNDSSGSLSRPFYRGDPDQALQRLSWLKIEKQDHPCKKMFHTIHRSQSCWKGDFYFFLSMLWKVLTFPSFISSLKEKKDSSPGLRAQLLLGAPSQGGTETGDGFQIYLLSASTAAERQASDWKARCGLGLRDQGFKDYKVIRMKR